MALEQEAGAGEQELQGLVAKQRLGVEEGAALGNHLLFNNLM